MLTGSPPESRPAAKTRAAGRERNRPSSSSSYDPLTSQIDLSDSSKQHEKAALSTTIGTTSPAAPGRNRTQIRVATEQDLIDYLQRGYSIRMSSPMSRYHRAPRLIQPDGIEIVED